jgi:hypothetical protein
MHAGYSPAKYAGRSPARVDGRLLREAIEEEMARNTSKQGWKGEGVPIKRNTFSLTPLLRAKVQNVGLKHGCHTCLTVLKVDADQPWIGDHIPPTELSNPARKAFGLEKKGSFAKLYPQCDSCSSLQSAFVRKLNGMSSKALEKFDAGDDIFFLIGGQPESPTYYVDSTGPKVSPGQGQDIQKLGQAHGCHTCGSKYPRTIYHADHIFPQEWCTTYMKDVFEALGLGMDYPKHFELRPQCTKCSGHQGGKIASIMWDAVNFALQNGIMVMKDMQFTTKDMQFSIGKK